MQPNRSGLPVESGPYEGLVIWELLIDSLDELVNAQLEHGPASRATGGCPFSVGSPQ